MSDTHVQETRRDDARRVEAVHGWVTIGEAARLVGLSIDAIRYYEREGLLLAPASRGPDGRRRFHEPDLAWLRGLVMLRGTGMGVDDLRTFSAAYRSGADATERLHLLEQHRDGVLCRLEEIQVHLGALESKIARYREAAES